MEYVGVVCRLMRLLSVTDKCKKAEENVSDGLSSKGPSFETSNAAALYPQGVMVHNRKVILIVWSCVNTMLLTASAFVRSHPVDYQRQSRLA